MKTKRFLSLILIFLCAAALFFVSSNLMHQCSEERVYRDEVSAAEALLQTARDAADAQQFDVAHACIDSLRKTYPRAFNTRRDALLFEDTLNLMQARWEYAVADSADAESLHLKVRFFEEKIRRR